MIKKEVRGVMLYLAAVSNRCLHKGVRDFLLPFLLFFSFSRFSFYRWAFLFLPGLEAGVLGFSDKNPFRKAPL